jgi:hypothetical protein
VIGVWEQHLSQEERQHHAQPRLDVLQRQVLRIAAAVRLQLAQLQTSNQQAGLRMRLHAALAIRIASIDTTPTCGVQYRAGRVVLWPKLAAQHWHAKARHL